MQQYNPNIQQYNPNMQQYNPNIRNIIRPSIPYQQNGKQFFTKTPDEKIGEEQKSSHKKSMDKIARRIIDTNDLSIIKNLSSRDVEKVLKLIKKRTKNEDICDTDKIVLFDVPVSKISENSKKTINIEEIKDTSYKETGRKKTSDDNVISIDIGKKGNDTKLVNNGIKIQGNIYDIDEYVEATDYNNFMIEVEKPINDINNITFNKYDVNINNNNINDCNNVFEFNNGEHQKLFIDNDKYTIQQLIQVINDTLEYNEIQMKLEMRDDNRISITSQSEFELFNGKNSVLKVFGYVSKKYESENEYISENAYSLADDIIPEIHVICNGDKNNKIIFKLNESKYNTKKFKNPIQNIKNIIIKVKQNDKILYDLQKHAPKIDIKFT
jgi:hypothetical protein